MLKYIMIINVKLEDKYMIKIEKIDKIAASRKHSYSAPQWQAIAITGADVLVAAAAGSGKTEVGYRSSTSTDIYDCRSEEYDCKN